MMTIAAMTEIANQAGNEIWPSLSAASRWFDRASILLAISLLFSFGATVVIVWLGIVKEHHWDLLREHSNERVAGLEAETAKANAELGRANADIAKANVEIADARKQTAMLENEAAQARLEQERLKATLAWRRLEGESFNRFVSRLRGPPIKITLSSIASDPESTLFAADIQKALVAAGFQVLIQNGVYFGGTPIIGLIVTGPRADIFRIATAFTLAGFSNTIRERQGDIEILVGSKPPP